MSKQKCCSYLDWLHAFYFGIFWLNQLLSEVTTYSCLFLLLLRTYAHFNFLIHWASANGRAMTCYLLCIAGWCGHSWKNTAHMCACRIHLCLQKHGLKQVSVSQNKSTRIDIKAVRPVNVGKQMHKHILVRVIRHGSPPTSPPTLATATTIRMTTTTKMTVLVAAAAAAAVPHLFLRGHNW